MGWCAGREVSSVHVEGFYCSYTLTCKVSLKVSSDPSRSAGYTFLNNSAILISGISACPESGDRDIILSFIQVDVAITALTRMVSTWCNCCVRSIGVPGDVVDTL